MSISLWIYFAEVLSNLGLYFFIAGLGSLIGAGIVIFVTSMEIHDTYRNEERVEKLAKMRKKFFIYGLVIGMSTLFVSAFFPGKETIKLMAVAAVGEQIAKSEQVQSIVDPSMDLVKTWLQKQTEELKKK